MQLLYVYVKRSTNFGKFDPSKREIFSVTLVEIMDVELVVRIGLLANMDPGT